MNEQRAFWKGFLLAGGLAVVFIAGRVSAGPVPTPKVLDDTASAVKDVASKVGDVTSKLSTIADKVQNVADSVDKLNRDGVQIKGAYNSANYPIHVKSDK